MRNRDSTEPCLSSQSACEPDWKGCRGRGGWVVGGTRGGWEPQNHETDSPPSLLRIFDVFCSLHIFAMILIF